MHPVKTTPELLPTAKGGAARISTSTLAGQAHPSRVIRDHLHKRLIGTVILVPADWSGRNCLGAQAVEGVALLRRGSSPAGEELQLMFLGAAGLGSADAHVHHGLDGDRSSIEW
jgi:hypothetical protein